jgi:hypothetical protein
MTDETENFTPTQELIMDLLVARARLGENVWTFSTRVTKAVEDLSQKGHVYWKSAPTYGHILVWLTEESKNKLLSFPYEAPILKKYKLKKKYKKQ